MAQNVTHDKNPSTDPQARVTARMWIRTVLICVFLPAVILFGAAGTHEWPMAWLYIALTVGSFAVSRLFAWRAHPDLLRERGRMMDHEDTASFDRVLAPLLALAGPALIGLVAGFAKRFDWLPVFDPWVEWLGIGLLLLGNVIGSWALVVNRFFSGVVRIQKERGHHVVTSGPYAIVRHPGYLSVVFSYLGMVLMLGSAWALIPLALQQVVLVLRTALEDQTLQAELPGYSEYAKRTRFRLIPGIW